MIRASKITKEFIRNQNSIEDFADKLGVTKMTVYTILDNGNVSSAMIAKLLNETGFDFEKAFEVKED